MAAGSLAPPSRSTRGASLLPSVKCSTCALLVPLDELGDHVCAPLPPGSPALTATSGSTSSAASSQASLFSKITSMASTDSVNSRTRPLHKPSMSSSTEASSMSGSSRSSRALSSGSTSSRRPMRMPPPSGPIPPTPNSAQRPAGSPSPVPSFSQPHAALAQTLPRRQSPSIPRPPGSPPKEPLPPLPIPSSLTFSTDTRAPSPNRAPSPIPSSAFQVPFPRSPSPAPSFRGPSPTPSSALPSALMPGSASRGLPNNANSLFPRTDSSLPSPSSGRLSPSSPNSQHTSYFSTPPPSTEIGGEAGRAGVGRRAFHAVAHAAMFTGGIPQQHGNPLNQRRPPAPQFLDIGAIYGPGTPPLSPSPYSPYSSHSPSPRSPIGPVNNPLASPSDHAIPALSKSWENESVQPLRVRTSSSGKKPPSVAPLRVNSANTTPNANGPGMAGDPLPSTPSLPFFEKYRQQGLGQSNSQSSSGSREEKSDPDNVPRPSSPAGSENSCELAYAADDADEENDGDKLESSELAKDSIAFPSRDHAESEAEADDEFGMLFASALFGADTSSAGGGPLAAGTSGTRNRVRTVSGSSYSSYTTVGYSNHFTTRPPSKSTGALDDRTKRMETLVEEPTEGGESIAGSSSSSSGGGAGAEGKGQNLGGALGLAYSRSNPLGSSALHIKAPPTRSLTSPAGQSKKRGPSTREKKVCMRCEKTIEDGRWIPVDTDRAGKSGVLCEKDWKEMYLPKCRRCELPIERQAVSSADGQLKGKYHRDCFNCHECHTPFPDKSFYVFDGKPFCKYHYHRANRSLCMLASCGEPIEGPCAEDHDARRYHPEHMLCDEEGCDERLVEYWEMAGGRKFCEGCARAADVDSRWGGSSVADDMDMSVYSGSSGGSGSALQYATTAPLRLGRSRSALAKKEAEAEAGKGVGEAKDKDKELNKGREQEQEQDSGAKKAKAKAMKRRTRFLQLGADGEEEEL